MPSEDGPSDEPLWTPEETAFLQSHLEAFVKGDKNTRKDLLISTVLPEMKRRRRDMPTEQWKHRKTQIKWWFYNHKEPAKTDFDLGRKVHVKTIISHLWGQELRATSQEMSGEVAGSRAFFKVYSKVYADFKKNMTPQQKQQLKEAQDNWDVQHPPELQYKNATQQLEKVLLSIAKMLYREFGMVVVIGEYHKVSEHQSSFLVHDYSNLVGENRPPKSFTDLHPNLLNRFKTALIKYMSYDVLRSLEVPSDEDGGQESQAQSQTRSSTPGIRQAQELQCDGTGYPILPSRSSAVESTQLQRDLVSKFVTIQYRLACGRPDDNVPWRLIAAENASFIKDTYLNTKLEDPGMMSKPNLTKLLQFWRGRQVAGPISEVFRFWRCLEKHYGNAIPASYPNPMDHSTIDIEPEATPEINMFTEKDIDPSLRPTTSFRHTIAATQDRNDNSARATQSTPIPEENQLVNGPFSELATLMQSPQVPADAPSQMQPSPTLFPPPIPPTSVMPIVTQRLVTPEAEQDSHTSAGTTEGSKESSKESHPTTGASDKPPLRRSEVGPPEVPIVSRRRTIKPTTKVIAAREQQGEKQKRALSAADTAEGATKKARGL